MTTTLAASAWLIERLRSGELFVIPERYAASVLLDLNTPASRVQLQGRDAATQALAERVEEMPNARVTWTRTMGATDTVVAEYELRWDGRGGEHLARAVSVLRLVDGEIVEHCEYCTGPWTPADIARNKAEAPIVRW